MKAFNPAAKYGYMISVLDGQVTESLIAMLLQNAMSVVPKRYMHKVKIRVVIEPHGGSAAWKYSANH
jgi:hypothetical protein